MAAASVPVIIALIGGGLDMSRVYKARNRLQSACDAGTLAGRRAVSTNGYGTAEKAQAATFFNTNFVSSDVGAKDTTFVTTSTDSGNLVKGTATTKVETAVMDIFGFDTIDVTVNCSATMGVGNSDITMVLDTTGSMGSTLSGTSETRIQALRAAMKNFYTTVSNATQGSNARVRYSFVPYSSSVNVGKLILDRDEDFLVDEWPIQSREAVFKTITEKVFTGWNNPVFSSSEAYSTETDGDAEQYNNTNYNNNSSCNNAKPDDIGWANNGSPSTNPPTTTTNGAGQQVVTTRTDQPQRKTTFICLKSGSKRRIFYYYTYRTYYTYAYQTSDPVYEDRTREEFSHFAYKQIAYDVSVYKQFQSVSVNNGSNGTPVSYLWKGCIEERETEANGSFSYSSLTGMSPSDAYDLNIDDLPEDNDAATKWAPMWPEVAYYRTYTSNGNTYLSTSAETTRGSQANSYCPYRAQLLQTMTKAGFDAYADALSPEGSTYHDIGMLWGLRLNSPEGPWQSLVNDPPSNGGKVSRHIIFMTDGEMAPSYTIQSIYGIEWHDRRITNDGYSNQASRHTARFRALCDAAKAKGFRVWVIAFASSMTSDLSYCASSNSAYTASSSAQLNTAFQEIAKNVGELRIYQ
jgi:Flp pilus assembly protein TadG